MSNFSCIPLTALSAETKYLISTLLNPPKVIPSSNGSIRDWRGLAQKCKIRGELLPDIHSDPDPSNKIFTIIQKESKQFTLENLKKALEDIERWDIIDDSESYLEKDAEEYIKRLEHSQDCAEENNFDKDADILTLDDQFRIERGEEKQHYDAFILYADEDIDFVNEVVEKLEKNNNFKLCLKDRDLIAGISFEHEAIMKLISERCNRLIPIVSPDFLKSPDNKFFLNFAQAVGIDKQQERKIIPCIYKNCDLPLQLTGFSKIYYKHLAPDFFWDKLIRSMKAVPCAQKSTVVPNEYVSVINDKENGHLKTKSEEKEDVKENLSGESSKSVQSIKNQSFPWLRKIQKFKKDKLSNTNEVSDSTEAIPNLPSLGGLDSFSSLSNSENQTKKCKRKTKLFKKFQSLLTKS